MFMIHRGWHAFDPRAINPAPQHPATLIVTAYVTDALGLDTPYPAHDTPHLLVRFGRAPSARLRLRGVDAPLPWPSAREWPPASGDTLDIHLDLDRLSSPEEGCRSAVTRFAQSLPPLSLVIRAQPWEQAWEEQAFVHSGRRTLWVSAAGEYAGTWYDGPLAHIRAEGDVASFVPSGGKATLALPASLAGPSQGLVLSDALALEGEPAQKAHRCLLGRLEHHLGAQSTHDFLFTADILTLKEACLLVLMRQARPDARLQLFARAAAYGAHKGPWRRFAQNIGLLLVDHDPQHLGIQRSPLPSHLIPDLWTEALAQRMDHLSDVIPQSLLRSSPG